METVLVVDDDEHVLRLVDRVLTRAGYEVQSARDGAEALRLAEARRPDLIVLDLKMPVMDGPTFRQEQLRRPALARVPVLVLSGRPNDDHIAELLGVPRISKPFEMHDLLSTVRRLCTGDKPRAVD
jgi:two-component system KDP operon response regulator KdpE